MRKVLHLTGKQENLFQVLTNLQNQSMMKSWVL